MDDSRRHLRKQWTQLIALAGGHFVLDTFPGLMHTVLPAFQESFKLSVAAGAVLLTAFLVAANGIQVLIGHMRPEHDKPLFLYIGTLLTCTIILFWVVPSGGFALVWLSIISVACGTGVGMTHPEFLKAIHRLDRISPAVSSSIFMAGGFIGFAAGGWASTYLFTWWGLGCLIPFCVASIVALAVIMLLGIRLAVERDEPKRRALRQHEEPVSFWLIMAIATLTVSSVTVMGWIIPQRINELGIDLTTGGAAIAIYSIAGGVGGVVMARWAGKIGELKLVRTMLMCGIPFVIGYLPLMRYSWAMVLLFIGGFFCFGAYPLMVSAARHSRGPNLGRRMGFIVGGIWLAACVLPMLLGPIAKQFGTVPILFCVPVGFVLSLALAIKAKKSAPKSKVC